MMWPATSARPYQPRRIAVGRSEVLATTTTSPRQNLSRNTAPAHPTSTAARAPARRGSAASRLAAAALRASGTHATPLTRWTPDGGRTRRVACCAARQNPHSFKKRNCENKKIMLQTVGRSIWRPHIPPASDRYISRARPLFTPPVANATPASRRSAAVSFSSEHRHQPGERS